MQSPLSRGVRGIGASACFVSAGTLGDLYDFCGLCFDTCDDFCGLLFAATDDLPFATTDDLFATTEDVETRHNAPDTKSQHITIAGWELRGMTIPSPLITLPTLSILTNGAGPAYPDVCNPVARQSAARMPEMRRNCVAERPSASAASLPAAAATIVLSGTVRTRRQARCARRAIDRAIYDVLSIAPSIKTVWRRGWDSNP